MILSVIVMSNERFIKGKCLTATTFFLLVIIIFLPVFININFSAGI